MIKQVIDVDGYWEIVVYFNVDYYLLKPVYEDLKDAGFPKEDIYWFLMILKAGEAKAVTCSNGYHHESVVLFNKHQSEDDYLDSLVHEAEHVKQAMLAAYDVEDEGEPPAYTIGHLVERMYHVFGEMVCNCKAYD
jgi:hypothetical protein